MVLKIPPFRKLYFDFFEICIYMSLTHTYLSCKIHLYVICALGFNGDYMFFKDTILKDAVMKVFSYSLILLLICYFFSPFAYCGEENTLPSSIKAGDLSMSVDDCIDTALKNNYDLYSETLVLDKFYRALEEQNNGRLPEIYFEYINRGAAIFDAADYLSSEAGFRITQPIYHGGEITYNQEEALLNYEKRIVLL